MKWIGMTALLCIAAIGCGRADPALMAQLKSMDENSKKSFADMTTHVGKEVAAVRNDVKAIDDRVKTLEKPKESAKPPSLYEGLAREAAEREVEERKKKEMDRVIREFIWKILEDSPRPEMRKSSMVSPPPPVTPPKPSEELLTEAEAIRRIDLLVLDFKKKFTDEGVKLREKEARIFNRWLSLSRTQKLEDKPYWDATFQSHREQWAAWRSRQDAEAVDLKAKADSLRAQVARK